jgi:DNA-binding response OmpR family regulator
MPKKILVVEDHPETRDIITILLEENGYNVSEARDGYEGIVMAAAERPDLIVTDLNLPIVYGVEMIRILRQRPEYRNTPILAITALGSEHTREAINAGADHTMAKPLEPDSFLFFVRQLLKREPSDNSTAVG